MQSRGLFHCTCYSCIGSVMNYNTNYYITFIFGYCYFSSYFICCTCVCLVVGRSPCEFLSFVFFLLYLLCSFGTSVSCSSGSDTVADARLYKASQIYISQKRSQSTNVEGGLEQYMCSISGKKVELLSSWWQDNVSSSAKVRHWLIAVANMKTFQL